MNIKFLAIFAAVALLFASASEARSHHSHKTAKVPKQMRDYYPQMPHYPHSPVNKKITGGVLGSVLGYEIAKDNAMASGLGVSADAYLGHGKTAKR